MMLKYIGRGVEASVGFWAKLPAKASTPTVQHHSDPYKILAVTLLKKGQKPNRRGRKERRENKA